MTKLAMVKWCNVRFVCVVVIGFNPSSIAMPSRLVPYNAFFLRKGLGLSSDIIECKINTHA